MRRKKKEESDSCMCDVSWTAHNYNECCFLLTMTISGCGRQSLIGLPSIPFLISSFAECIKDMQFSRKS